MQKKIVGVRSLIRICEGGVDVLEHSPSVGDVISDVFAASHSEIGVALLTGTSGKTAPASDADPSVVLLCELIHGWVFVLLFFLFIFFSNTTT